MALIITFINKTNLSPVSNYDYQVMVGDGSVERTVTIESGKVLNHTRDDGWVKLVELMLEQRRRNEKDPI